MTALFDCIAPDLSILNEAREHPKTIGPDEANDNQKRWRLWVYTTGYSTVTYVVDVDTRELLTNVENISIMLSAQKYFFDYSFKVMGRFGYIKADEIKIFYINELD